MKFFNSIPLLKPDKLFGIVNKFIEDPRSDKITAAIGAYRDEQLKPYVFKSIREAERRLELEQRNKEYLPISGDPAFITLTQKLVFGGEKSLAGVQTVGGTGALRVCAEFLKKSGFSQVWLSNPTWVNHHRIFNESGFEIREYPYYNKGLDFDALIACFEKMGSNSVVVMQPACHNPTGCDLSMEQWKRVYSVVHKRSLFIIFDFAYQGFGVGLDEDAAPIRYFLDQGMEFAVAISHSKNFGLYAERVGALYVNSEKRDEISSHLKAVIRAIYSNPPCHGAALVATILQDEQLCQAWKMELEAIRTRISEMRLQLADELNFDFLRTQRGMFSYIGLEKEVVEKLRTNYGIYLPDDGRINVAGLNSATVHRVAIAISECEKEKL